MTKSSEQEILAAITKGKHKAFDELFVRYFNRVRFFIQGIIKSEAESEELAQNIFVKIWIGRNQIDPNKPFSPYLFTITRNTVYNYIKHKQVRNDFAKKHIEDLCVSPEESIHAKDMTNLIGKSLEKMPTQRRKIVHLSKFIGLSNQEIALKLQISKKTVENQLSLAVQEIRRNFRRS